MLGPVASVAADPASERRNPGVEVPMPTLPSIINPPVGAAVVSYPLPKLPPPLTLNIDPGAVSPMPTLPLPCCKTNCEDPVEINPARVERPETFRVETSESVPAESTPMFPLVENKFVDDAVVENRFVVVA